jgi:predicted dinucleotide-binding enzyme
MAEWALRAVGALVVVIAVPQESVERVYLPPVFKTAGAVVVPPQMSISLPVQTADIQYRAEGALVVEIVEPQELVAGS